MLLDRRKERVHVDVEDLAQFPSFRDDSYKELQPFTGIGRGFSRPERRYVMKIAVTSVAVRRGRARVVMFVMAVLAIFLAGPAAHHARATTLLLSFSDPQAKPVVTEELLTIDVPASKAGAARTVKARMFSPPGGTPKDRPYFRGAGVASGSGVAYGAHVIGFVVGAALVWGLRGQRQSVTGRS